MSYKTDMGRVIGLGSAKTGAKHWLGERIKAVAMIPLTIAFVCIVGPLIGASHDQVTAAFQSPLRAVLVILFLLVCFKHLEEGLQVVIEDYVHSKGMVIGLMVVTKLACWGFGLAGIFATAKLAFAG